MYPCVEKQHKKENKTMARPIRAIPTLFGRDAEAFLRAAEATEANPGRISISSHDVELVHRMMAEANML